MTCEAVSVFLSWLLLGGRQGTILDRLVEGDAYGIGNDVHLVPEQSSDLAAQRIPPPLIALRGEGLLHPLPRLVQGRVSREVILQTVGDRVEGQERCDGLLHARGHLIAIELSGSVRE